MSDLTEQQQKALRAAVCDCDEPDCFVKTDVRWDTLNAVVAAMLAHERAARETAEKRGAELAESVQWWRTTANEQRARAEAAEARLAATEAAILALADSLTVPGKAQPCEPEDYREWCCGTRCEAMSPRDKVIGAADLRALVADGGVLDRARADAWREGYKARGYDVPGIGHVTPNPYRAEGEIQTEADFDAAFNEADR